MTNPDDPDRQPINFSKAPQNQPPQNQPPQWQQPPPQYGQAPPYRQQPYAQPSYGQPAQYGNQPPAGLYFDQASQLNLPVGTTLASPGRRIGAYFLAIPLSIITLGIGYLIWGLVVWGRGQTPALQVLGMRVWRPETGRTATFGWMALREIPGRIVDGILSIVTLLTSFILFLALKEHKSLHDLVAGTVVLHDPNKVLVS